jgi:hypothetical protein
MATQNSTPTQEEIKSLFNYIDGEIYRKSNNKLCLSISSNGYKRVFINGKNYYTHRIIYLAQYGYMPDQIDHIDGNTLNNRIENLREASYQDNNRNRKKSIRNKSGYKNVIYVKKTGKWRVQFSINKKTISIGSFENLGLAVYVAAMTRKKYHGSFARHE